MSRIGTRALLRCELLSLVNKRLYYPLIRFIQKRGWSKTDLVIKGFICHTDFKIEIIYNHIRTQLKYFTEVYKIRISSLDSGLYVQITEFDHNLKRSANPSWYWFPCIPESLYGAFWYIVSRAVSDKSNYFTR